MVAKCFWNLEKDSYDRCKDSERFLEHIDYAEPKDCRFNRLSRRIATDKFHAENKYRYKRQRLNEKRKELLRTLENILAEMWQLDSDENNFKQRIIEFNQLVIINEEKRERCIERINTDQCLINERERMMKQIKEDIERIKWLMNGLTKRIESHLIYEEYITRARESTSLFASNYDVILRFALLGSMRQNRAEDTNEKLSSLQSTAFDLKRLIETKCARASSLRNGLTRVCDRYEESRRRTGLLEKITACVVGESRKRMCDYSMTLGSADNIYRRRCQRLQQRHADVALNFEKRLKVVGKELRAVNQVYTTITQQTLVTTMKASNKWRRLMYKLIYSN